jgi:hypothetical protein
MDNLFRAYSAGFVDADGSVGVYRSRDSWRVILQVTQRSPAILYQLQAFYCVGTVTPRSQPHQWDWRVRARDEVEDTLLQMLPYLLVKRRQALYAIQACRLLRKGQLRKLERVAYHVKDLKRNAHHPSIETFGGL